MVRDMDEELLRDIYDKYGYDRPDPDLMQMYAESILKLCGDTCYKITCNQVLIDNNFGNGRPKLSDFTFLFVGCTCYQEGNSPFAVPNIGIKGTSGTSSEFVEEKESFQSWSP